MEIGAGIAAVEESDDRQRPSYALHAGFHPFYYSRLFYYGRDFGPVEERTTLISFNRRLGLFRSNYLKAGIGGAILSERTTISYNKEEDKPFEKDENKFNAGLYTGIYWEMSLNKPYYLSAGWEAAIFPAGLNGGLLLATGRKQFLSLIVGMSL